ncbi:MAG: hypothetical protein RTU92_10815 [Candidatus Thorarchaeota archaeon]
MKLIHIMEAFVLRQKYLVVSLITVFLLVSICGIPTNETVKSEEILIIQSDYLTPNQVFDLSDQSNRIRKPIVVFSPNPVIVTVQTNETECTLDLQTGILTEGLPIQKISNQYSYWFTIVEPGNTIREFEFVRDSDNKSRFIGALNAEINRLERTLPTMVKDVELSRYVGDVDAWAEKWYWAKEVERVISAIDVDSDGYTWETTLKRNVWRSINNYEGYPDEALYWLSEWRMSTAFDDDDYKADYLQWVGPWVTSRWLKYSEDYCNIYDWGPTSSVGSWSYSFSTGIKIGGDGPQVTFALSQSWSGPEVAIDDDTSEVYDNVEWSETFTGPTYIWFPLLYEPCVASANTYLSRRGVEWNSGRFGMTGTQEYEATVLYDTNFYFLLFGLTFTRYTTHVSHSYPVYCSGPSGW